jgi:hypothetical protein
VGGDGGKAETRKALFYRNTLVESILPARYGTRTGASLLPAGASMQSNRASLLSAGATMQLAGASFLSAGASL